MPLKSYLKINKSRELHFFWFGWCAFKWKCNSKNQNSWCSQKHSWHCIIWN